MAKVIIHLRDFELTALNDLAQREYHAPKAQAALIVRKELQKLGLVPSETLVQTHRDDIQSMKPTC